jgi:RNA polymerase primary sigma factor
MKLTGDISIDEKVISFPVDEFNKYYNEITGLIQKLQQQIITYERHEKFYEADKENLRKRLASTNSFETSALKLAKKEIEFLKQKINKIQERNSAESPQIPLTKFIEPLVGRLDLSEALKNSMKNCLTKKEICVIKFRIFQGMTLEETGKTMDICKERVRQIESKAFRKLRNKKNNTFLSDFKDEYLESGERY